MDKATFWKKLTVFLWGTALPVLVTGIVRAIAIYTFVTPNHFAPGGVGGVAVLLEYGTHINSGWFLLILNVPLFFVAFFCVSKRSAFMATLSMLLSSGLLILFEYIHFPIFEPEASQSIGYGIIAAIAGGILLAIPLAVLLKTCNTAGGTSIIASVVNKKWKHLSVNWLTFAFDASVVISSFFVYYNSEAGFAVNLMPVLLALISLYVTSKVNDLIFQGLKQAYKFEIVTDNPEEIAAEIMEKTHHGVTLMHATGMYTHTDKSMLICIIRKRQVAAIQRIIRNYPGTFAYFSQTNEVYGKFAK